MDAAIAENTYRIELALVMVYSDAIKGQSMSNPTISVIIPAYNAEQSLERCANSVLSQSFTDFELIVVDDGSTDATASVANAVAAKDNRVRVVHKANGGVSSARNVGLDAASGTYVTFVDSDDAILAGCLVSMMQAMQRYHADLCIVGYRSRISRLQKTINHCIENEYAIDTSSMPDKCWMNAICELESKSYLFQCWGKLYRRQCLDGLRFNERISYGEDTVFVFDLLQRHPKIIALPGPLYEYEETQTGLASRFRLDKPSDLLWQHGHRLKIYRFDELTRHNQDDLCRRLANDVLWAIDAVRKAPHSVSSLQKIEYISRLTESPYRRYYLYGLKHAAVSRLVKILYVLNIDLLWSIYIR